MVERSEPKPNFESCGTVDLVFYARRFPEVCALLMKDARALSADDTLLILTKLTSLGDFALAGHFLPAIALRYAHSHMPRVELLYARLLDWGERWSQEQYHFLTNCAITHWSSVLREHHPPDRLTVFSNEVSFLLLWLVDPAPLMPFLTHLAQMCRNDAISAEEWAEFHWVPFIEGLKSNPIQTLIEHATAGSMAEISQDRTSEVKRTLVSAGLAVSAW